MSALPRVILVHGTRFDSREWEGYAESMPGCEVVAVDLPGHGTRAGSVFTLETALAVIDDAVLGAVDALPEAPVGDAVESPEAGPDEVGAPVVLVGHSLGGYLAAEYARLHPRRIAGLGLVGAAADPTRHPRLTRLYTGFAALLPVVGADRMARFANAVIRTFGVARDALPGPEGYGVTQDAWAAVIGMAGVHQVRELTCPVLVVNGSLDQLGIDARHYGRAAPGAWVVTVPRATHLFPLTHREQLVSALVELVDRAVGR